MPWLFQIHPSTPLVLFGLICMFYMVYGKRHVMRALAICGGDSAKTRSARREAAGCVRGAWVVRLPVRGIGRRRGWAD